MPVGTPRGAYGLRVVGLSGAGALLGEPGDGWAEWRVERVAGKRPAALTIGADHASLALDGGTALEIDRERASATFVSPTPPSDAELVHPYLGAVAAVVGHWRGLQTLHCGALIVDGGAWGVLGERGRGKSTLLAWAATRAGIPVVSDDLLVVKDGFALAGPRCVDLRRDAAEALGVGSSIGVVGQRERWRVPLGSVAPETALRGWVALEWGEEVAVRRMAAAARMHALVQNVAVVPPPSPPRDLFELSALPMFEFVRPREIASVERSGEELLSALHAGA